MEIVLTELAEFDSVVGNGALRVSRFTLAKNVSDCSYKSELATTRLAFSKSVTFWFKLSFINENELLESLSELTFFNSCLLKTYFD